MNKNFNNDNHEDDSDNTRKTPSDIIPRTPFYYVEKSLFSEIESISQTLSDTLNEHYIANEAMKPVIDTLKRLDEVSKPIKNMIETTKTIPNLLNSINLEDMRSIFDEVLTEIITLIKEFEEQLWCLDFDILDAFKDEEITQEKLINYIDNNLDKYVEEMIAEPMFNIHRSLLKESLEAYKHGHYKLCTYSLFSIFEHILSSWYVGNIKKTEVSVQNNPKIRRLFDKVKNLTEQSRDERTLLKIFTQPILHIYTTTFTNIPEYLNTELNRNSITHGFHDYDSINKEDILKLFQLLKSTLILRNIEIKDFENNSK